MADLTQTVKLRYPVEHEGKSITEINLNFMVLSGAVQRKAAKRYLNEGGVPGAERASDNYLVIIASECCGLPTEALDLLIGPDFAEVMLMVQNFLLDTPWMQEQSAKPA